MNELLKYFPHLTVRQIEQFAAVGALYEEWNARINVISRRDMASGELWVRHILHSLAIARVCSFGVGARVMDVGTGGGFPAIPLAIVFPEASFTAVDSIGKKIRVVSEVARELGLANVRAVNGRAESVPGCFDYVVSRAVAPVAALKGWVWSKIERGQAGMRPMSLSGSRSESPVDLLSGSRSEPLPDSLPNGMLLLKGGDLTDELAAAGFYESFAISDWFDEDFFETKKVIYIPKT